MSRLWVGIIAGVGGFALGLYVAKLYATATITSDVNSGLNAVGLGGGKIQGAVDALIPVAVD